jgi:four helix bundle protein
MTRAAVSIASNIAEGAERNSHADFIRFLCIAKGSAAELRTQVYIAGKLDVIKRQQAKDLIAELKIISGMLYNLINFKRTQGASR